MRVFFRFMLAAGLALGAAPAAAPAQMPSVEEMAAQFPDYFSRLELGWEHYFQPPFSEARHFAVFNLHLLSAVQQEGEPVRLYRQRMSAGGMRGEVSALETAGLPEDFLLEAMTPNAYTQSLVLVGRTGDGPAAFAAVLDTAAIVLEEWEPLPPLPEGVEGRFFKAHSYDGNVFLFARVPAAAEGFSELAGYTLNLALPESMQSWVTMPPPPAARRGESVVMLRNSIFVLGGEEYVEEGTARAHIPMQARYEVPDFTPWERPFRPVDLRLRDTVGFGYGSAVFLASRTPLVPQVEEGEEPPPPPELMEFQYAPDLGGGQLGHWRTLLVEHEPGVIRSLTLDPGHSRLLLLTEAETGDGEPALHLSAYMLPTWVPGRQPSDEEAHRAHLARHAIEPSRLPVEALLESVREYESHGLIILPGDNADTALDVRLRMGSTRHRYMTMGAVTTFLEGSQGESARQRYGVSSTPAYVLIDKNGEVVGRHEGSIPSNEQLFELTSPIRSGGTE